MSNNKSEHDALKAQILEYSRQKNIRPLTPWLDRELDKQIEKGRYPSVETLERIGDHLVAQLATYRKEHKISGGVMGMSGGLDSALTAALFKKAGWDVLGVTLPIHQNPEETERGIEAIHALGLEEYQIDLTEAYDAMLGLLGDDSLATEDTQAGRIRRGNLRARLRMIAQYNLAAKRHYLVCGSDNFSELLNSFQSLGGDNCTDVSPIQALTKSWEVPMLAKLVGVPEKTVRATPTDGLGIDAGDEAQFGYSYLESDLIMFAIMDAVMEVGHDIDTVAAHMDMDEATHLIFEKVYTRMRNGAFKRHWPAQLYHPLEDRYALMNEMDRCIAPHVVRDREKENKFSP